MLLADAGTAQTHFCGESFAWSLLGDIRIKSSQVATVDTVDAPMCLPSHTAYFTHKLAAPKNQSQYNLFYKSTHNRRSKIYSGCVYETAIATTCQMVTCPIRSGSFSGGSLPGYGGLNGRVGMVVGWSNGCIPKSPSQIWSPASRDHRWLSLADLLSLP